MIINTAEWSRRKMDELLQSEKAPGGPRANAVMAVRCSRTRKTRTRIVLRAVIISASLIHR
jgi:hypothetical protein